jgi:hypothetical protein
MKLQFNLGLFILDKIQAKWWNNYSGSKEKSQTFYFFMDIWYTKQLVHL